VIRGLGINPLLEDEMDLGFQDPEAKFMPHITVDRAETILRDNPKQFASQFCAAATDEEVTALFRLAKAYLREKSVVPWN
jgi:2'-5' RNA ligase